VVLVAQVNFNINSIEMGMGYSPPSETEIWLFLLKIVVFIGIIYGIFLGISYLLFSAFIKMVYSSTNNLFTTIGLVAATIFFLIAFSISANPDRY